MSDKIVNIGHADNVHIEGVGTPELSKMSEKIDTAIDRIPDLIESTIMLFFSKAASGQLNDNTVIFQDYTSSRPMPVSPVSLKSKREETYSVGDVVMSHWQIDGCIGKGSFSTVYAAHHTGRGMQFSSAIKVIHSALLPFSIVKDDDISYRTINATYMVQQELDNMVELKGTGYIVDYEDHEMVNYSDGSRDTLIRMELLEPLSDVLHSKTLSQDDVIRVGIDICKALELCYSNNIIHRDVKPSNIYLTKWGGYKLGGILAHQPKSGILMKQTKSAR